MREPFILLLAASLLGFVGQETRREVVHPSNTAQDARSNSDRVPDVTVFAGQVKRIVVLRLKYNTDLLAGLVRTVKEQKIENAVILSAIGSIRITNYIRLGIASFPSKMFSSRIPRRLPISSA